MDELCQRFPSMVQKILNHVDNETLINFKEAGRDNAAFLENERFYWIRIIQRYNCLIGELQEVWRKVVRKSPKEIIKELAITVHQFPKTIFKNLKSKYMPRRYAYEPRIVSPLEFVQKLEKQWHPLFIGAACGSVNLCNHIIQKTDVKEPRLTLRTRILFRAPILPINRENWISGEITPLVFAAVILGDVNVFRFLLEKAEDKNPIVSKHRNWTILHYFAGAGQMEMCRLMVEKVEDKRPQDIDGSTPYHLAAFIGHVELCRLLMEYHTDKNPKDFSDRTPFHNAASMGHLEVCRLFMDTCVDENHMDDIIRRPLQMAAWNGHLELCKILMERLMDKNPRDHIGQTPFHSATLEVYRLFMKTCADKNYKKYGLRTIRTSFQVAASIGHLELCRLLIELCEDLNTKDFTYPSHMTASKKINPQIISRLFMENKNHFENDGRHPRHRFAWNGHVDVVGLFMASAIEGGNLRVCKLLIEKFKVNVNLSVDYGMTPLHLAAKFGQLEIFKFLCKCVRDENILDNYGKTPSDYLVSGK